MTNKLAQDSPSDDGDGYRNGSNLPSPGLEVPFNFDMELFEFLRAINASPYTKFPVRIVYAADRLSLTGSGRGANSLPNRRFPIKDYIHIAHDVGIEFHYLYNSPNLGNQGWLPPFREALHRHMDELAAAGVDCCVAAHPVVLHMLREWHPELKRGSSVNDHLDSVERARQLIEFPGISNIMVDHRNSRNFPLVRALRKSFPNMDIIVLANESC